MTRTGEKQIDTTIAVVTPENIAFEYNVAGPFRRFPAFVLDVVIRAAVLLAVMTLGMIALGSIGLGSLALAGITILWFLFEWFYGGFLETFMNGQTPGKRMLGIRVISVSGRPINGIQAVLRNVLRSVDMFPMLSIQLLGVDAPAYILPTFMLSLVTMTLTPRFQRLGDIATGTMVITEERRWLTGVVKLDDERVAELASYIPPGFAVSRSLARTLSIYVERRRYFSPPRQRELARHVAEPLLRQFGFPENTGHDLLLCALYHRTFLTERRDGRTPNP